MKYLTKFTSGRKNTTLIKYFLSYFIILSILFLGFFFAVRVQLKNIYIKDLTNQTEKRLANVQTQFDNNLSNINQVQSMLTKNIDLVLSRYKNDNWYNYQASKQLSDYSLSNNFIDSIVYVDRKQDSILSSGKHVRRSDEGYQVYTGTHYISFPLDDYMDTRSNQLIYLSDDTSQLLIYLPYNSGIEDYSLFYIINPRELARILETGISAEVNSICLSTPKGTVVSGSNTDAIKPHLTNLDNLSGRHDLNSKEVLYATKALINDYSIIALFSNEAIINQVNIAFRNTYLLLLVLASVGMILILWAMRITYWPLHKLTTKMVDDLLPDQSYVEQLDSAFTTARTENKQLQQKVDNYRLSMQKSILDSIVAESSPMNIKEFPDIDQFFNLEPESRIFLIRAQTPKKSVSWKEYVKTLESALPGKNSCVILESNKCGIVFLINYSGIETHKDEALLLLLSDLYEETGCNAALSNSSVSPLEIPSLYENALRTSRYWEQSPVISYSEIKDLLPAQTNLDYPYESLNELSNHLKTQNFPSVRLKLTGLFRLIDKASDNGNAFPDFFIRCVLIDILTIIINNMNRVNIKFKTFSDLYFETLYLCRSCAYSEKREVITENIKQLVDTFETESANSAIHTTQIRQIIQENYTSPDFSISTLADTFQVSIAYISYLFKKKFNQNFSDYLWALRLEKAKGLLTRSDLSIDNVSISVGYLNTSSFRRKFKQETGLTPSKYRSGADEE